MYVIPLTLSFNKSCKIYQPDALIKKKIPKLNLQCTKLHSDSLPYYLCAICHNGPVLGGSEQQSCRPACASAISDQRLCYLLVGKYIKKLLQAEQAEFCMN